MGDNLNVWDWNPITGNPFIPPQDSPNSRHCPTIDEMAQIIHANLSVGDYLKTRVWTFMTSNDTHMTTVFNASGGEGTKAFLRLVRSLDFKKIRVVYHYGGRVDIEKLPRDTPFNGQPDGINNHLHNQTNHSVYGLVDDINHNALLGWLGPGTYPCWRSGCALCVLVGRSPTVNLGPQGQIQLTKRASCLTKNTVYVGVCLQCEEADSFTCYFGESQQELTRRCAGHLTCPCTTTNPLKNRALYPTIEHKRDAIQQVIAARMDPNGILRDWFSHVTVGGIHPGQQRISVVDIISHSFPRKNRERNLVEEHMFRDDDFVYMGMGRGCLNFYANNEN